MKIGIITRHIDLPVGFGTYANQLLNALGQIDKTNQYVIYTPHRPKRRQWPKNFSVKSFGVPHVRSKLSWWEHVAAPLAAKHDGVDLIHYLHTAAPLPLTGCPVITNVLDAIGWAMPEYRLPLVYDRLARRDIRVASHIVTISEAAKADIHRLLRVPTDKISVTHLATTARSQARVARHRPYWLFIGGAEKRKNLATVIEAFAEGDFRGMRLKVVGPTNPSPIHDDIKQLLSILTPAQAKRVDLLGRVNDAQLDRLYRQAMALVFPSRYEGFGLPPLEAMARRTPVITSNVSSLPEVAGEAALLVDPDDAHGLCEAMRRVKTEATLRRQMTAAGLETAKHFSWRNTARETLGLYDRLVS